MFNFHRKSWLEQVLGGHGDGIWTHQFDPEKNIDQKSGIQREHLSLSSSRMEVSKLCSIRPCKQRSEINAMCVKLFNRSLSQTHSFPCYLHDDAVILKKLRDFSTTAHAIFWPAFTALVSSLLLLIFWRLVGCGIWNDDGAHVSNTVNEISLTHFRA
nr:hypothetical transcript [Hymenolepis microstoma]